MLNESERYWVTTHGLVYPAEGLKEWRFSTDIMEQYNGAFQYHGTMTMSALLQTFYNVTVVC